jgi:hypothetical protein
MLLVVSINDRSNQTNETTPLGPSVLPQGRPLRQVLSVAGSTRGVGNREQITRFDKWDMRREKWLFRVFCCKGRGGRGA